MHLFGNGTQEGEEFIHEEVSVLISSCMCVIYELKTKEGVQREFYY